MVLAKTLAYYDVTTITAVKSFVVQTLGQYRLSLLSRVSYYTYVYISIVKSFYCKGLWDVKVLSFGEILLTNGIVNIISASKPYLII